MRGGLIIAGAIVSCMFLLSRPPENASACAGFTQVGARVLENQVPGRLPVKISFRAEKEAAFKKLENEQWVNDLELEIKNTGDKPIYWLEFALETPRHDSGGGSP